MRAEALKWENKRLAEAKAKLEAQLRDQSRRMSQMEDTLAELKNCSSKHSAPSRGPHSSFKVAYCPFQVKRNPAVNPHAIPPLEHCNMTGKGSIPGFLGVRLERKQLAFASCRIRAIIIGVRPCCNAEKHCKDERGASSTLTPCCPELAMLAEESSAAAGQAWVHGCGKGARGAERCADR